MVESQPPLVSVLMPAYNHEAYVEEAVRSVIGQNYSNVELIAIDDGSTDATPAILDRLSKELGFIFLRNDHNKGINPTLERAMERSCGEFLSILASDDLILPCKISRQIEHIKEHELDGVYANGFLLLPNGQQIPIDLDESRRHFAAGTWLQLAYCDDTKLPLLQSGLFRRDALLSIAPYRREFQSDDWVVLIKLLESRRIGFLNERLFLYRQHDSNTFRRYWQTLPMRIDVISKVTPEPLRTRAMAAIFASHARALKADGKGALARRVWLASVALNPSPGRAVAWAKARFGTAASKLIHRFKRDNHP